MVWNIIVKGNWCIFQTILCHLGIQTRALLFNSCNPVTLVLGVSFRTDSMTFNIELIPSNYHTDSTRVNLFPMWWLFLLFTLTNRFDKVGMSISFLPLVFTRVVIILHVSCYGTRCSYIFILHYLSSVVTVLGKSQWLNGRYEQPMKSAQRVFILVHTREN